MNALLFPYVAENPAFDEIFPEKSHYHLPLAGKMAGEYWLELCAMLHLEKVLIEDYVFDSECLDRFGNGQNWSLELHYGGAALCRDLKQIRECYAAYLNEGPVLIGLGAVLPDLEEIAELPDCRERVTDWGCLEEGVYLWEDGVFFRCRVPLHQYGTLKSYFDLNFALLNHPGIYVLPGYSAEGKMHLGMNVVIMEDCVIEPPAVLCDHVRIHRGCRLTNGVIAGSNVIVDRGTELKHSVILNHTFIGMEMEIRNKIVDSERVIDPETGAYVDHADGITMDNRRYRRLDWIRCGEFLLALGTAALLLIPYVICRVIFTLIKSPLWEYRLSVDRYSKFWLVLTGKGSLIRTPGDSRDSVFLPTEGFSGIMTPEQIEIDDLYYRHNRSLKLIFTLLLRGFINRSMSHELP